MNTRTLFNGLMVAAALAVAGPALAQDGTVITTGGERVTGHVRDMDRNGFTVQVGGDERRIMTPQIAQVDFGGGRELGVDELNRLRQGRQVVVLKDGNVLVGDVTGYERTMQGALADLPQSHAFRVRFNAEGGGERTFLSSEIARLYFNDTGNAAQATAGQIASQPSTQGGTRNLTLDANRPWTSTGITVRRGQTVQFASSGSIQLGLGADDVAEPAGSRTGRLAPSAPLPRIPAGALIGRIGNGQPFGIGNQASVPMPADGELFLGINDDQFGDNRGQFSVTVAAAGVNGGRAIRRR